MILSVCFDTSHTRQDTDSLSVFRERAAAVDAAMPDLVILAAEASEGVITPPAVEALVDSAWITGVIKNACVVAGLPAVHAVPFHVARALSAVDFLSAGRAGWMPITADIARFDASYATNLAGAGAEVVERTDDFVRATQALWDSWDDDALILNKTTGEYLDSKKVRRVDYNGPFYRTMGPLNAARPPQGYPVLVRDVDVVKGSSVAADVAIGSAEALAQERNVSRKLLRVDAGDQTALDAARDAVAAGKADGIHLCGHSALDALTALRTEFPAAVASGQTARQALGLDKPVNAFAEGVCS
jgi:hypothetical protein